MDLDFGFCIQISHHQLIGVGFLSLSITSILIPRLQKILVINKGCQEELLNMVVLFAECQDE